MEQVFVREAFESNFIAPLGPQVDAFEREFSDYTGIEHCVAVSSGTAAMHLALRCLGIGPGDEVLASTLTFIGSITPILFQGATPVFIDSDSLSWNMDPELLEQELIDCEKRGKLPKAVVPTDLYGQCADYGRILKICDRYGIPVVVDAAEALGALYQRTENRGPKTEDRRHETAGMARSDPDTQSSRLKARGDWRHAGKGAQAAVFSFNGNKIITTSGGGMLASDDEKLIAQARFLSQQARDPAPHYEHSTIGYNYRMSNIVAAIGRGQLQIVEERVRRKREIFAYYQHALSDSPGIEFMPEAAYGLCNKWLTVILITPEEFAADREQVRLALEDQNIESRPVWKPMHLQPVFEISNEQGAKSAGQKRDGRGRRVAKRGEMHQARVVGGRVAEDLFDRGLCLPSGTAMTDRDLDRVVLEIKNLARK
ncbi:aminotransferase class I/II-fold pyridoxal phosphate-dependent enzyme [Syntrophobacteraceae bacterium DRH4]|nr:aminotransferase class I/II-fold pyridoxal phosphate-dependent enzyme [Desulfoferrobacter suflitae]